ncbi:TonB family protein [Undibacterium piscinae]|uniref:TonB family protein n=1 Tax=Undibacterium piscinae TaxID=2495591 RepID=A0A6M4A431_9BURK|nr:TonB family protein [Undibacterium piscinae]
MSGNQVWSKDIFNSDLANRSKQQLRDMDALRAAPPVARKTEADERSRRRSILGSLEREVPLRMYVDSWRQKIERNGNLNYSQVSKDKARGDPVALVVLRSDGSVEEVAILRSSGRADLDEAVKRIVRVNAPYAAFPPNIAAKYDVIEIRRIWSFEDSLKLVEELR